MQRQGQGHGEGREEEGQQEVVVLHAHRRRDLKRTRHLGVSLDGIPVRDCFYADGRRGIIREYVRGEDGEFVLDLEWGRVKRRERRGKVTWVRL